jgi:hypothetical protein
MLGAKLDLVVGTPGRLTDMMRDQARARPSPNNA